MWDIRAVYPDEGLVHPISSPHRHSHPLINFPLFFPFITVFSMTLRLSKYTAHIDLLDSVNWAAISEKSIDAADTRDERARINDGRWCTADAFSNAGGTAVCSSALLVLGCCCLLLQSSCWQSELLLCGVCGVWARGSESPSETINWPNSGTIICTRYLSN